MVSVFECAAFVRCWCFCSGSTFSFWVNLGCCTLASTDDEKEAFGEGGSDEDGSTIVDIVRLLGGAAKGELVIGGGNDFDN